MLNTSVMYRMFLHIQRCNNHIVMLVWFNVWTLYKWDATSEWVKVVQFYMYM